MQIVQNVQFAYFAENDKIYIYIYIVYIILMYSIYI